MVFFLIIFCFSSHFSSKTDCYPICRFYYEGQSCSIFLFCSDPFITPRKITTLIGKNAFYVFFKYYGRNILCCLLFEKLPAIFVLNLIFIDSINFLENFKIILRNWFLFYIILFFSKKSLASDLNLS